MKIAIHDSDYTGFPNYALMKLSAYTCATCKHCIWISKGKRKTMPCAEYTDGKMLVVCDPPWDEACPKYEEVKNESQD